jgi:hypothetical protein
MPRYHAVAKKVGGGTTFTVMFDAKDNTDAIAELCAAAGVQNTNGLVEFEILEVLPKGEYKRAALKQSKELTAKERLEAHQAVVVSPAETSKESELTLAEKHYVPYTKQLAA